MIKLYKEHLAARMLSLSYGYLKHLRLNRQIGYITVGKRGVRYSENNLDEFIKQREQRINR